MTRFSTVTGFVAAVAWLVVTSNGCEAALVQGRSAATVAMEQERRSVQAPSLASILQADQAGRKNLQADQAGRKNLRPSATSSSSTALKGKEDNDALAGGDEGVKRRVMRQDTMGGAGGARPVKTLGGLSMQSKRMTKERTVDWAKQLGMSQKDVDQLVKANNAKEANMAARARFLSKSHSEADKNVVKVQRKLVQRSNKARKTPISSSSSSPSFLDAMRNKSSQLSSSNRDISHSHQRDLLRKTQESEINDACSDSNPTLVVGGAMVSGSLQEARNYTAESCAADSGNVGLWYKFVGQNAGVTLSTCSDENTNFDTQISVYTGSCDALQCLVGNDDSECGLSSTAPFFGEQDVTYHVRVHGYGEGKGEFSLTIEESNIAMETCEAMILYMTDPFSGTVCECTESDQGAVMTCQDDCSYCSTDQSVCATKATVSTITSSANAAVTAKSATYTYTQGVDGVLVFDTTECDLDGSCSACSVSFNGKQCNSCTPSQCGGDYASFDIDCANVDPNAASVSLCDYPAIESGPLQVLSSDAFYMCQRDPVEACNSMKAYEDENGWRSCECTNAGSDSSATLTCSDTSCPMSCNLVYTVCWNDSFATTFFADGQPSSSTEIKTYTEGRDETVAWEGMFNDVCSITVNGEACTTCGVIECPDGSLLPSVNCENIEVGASFDMCASYSVEGQTGVLQAFNDVGIAYCLTLADPQAICQQDVEYHALVGSTCECELDPVTGTDYILTCELSSCLSCNSENTVCANQGSSNTIDKYGQYHSSVSSYTYVSGGRDETVVLSGFGGYGEDCSVTVNGTPCTSCGPTTCTDEEFGYDFEGTAVDCENIETGAIHDSCGGYGGFVVDTGVFQVLSSNEFSTYCEDMVPDADSEMLDDGPVRRN